MSTPASTRPVRRLVAIAAVAVAAVVGAIVIPLSAQAAPVALSGTVEGPSGTVIGGVTVTALEYESGPTPTSVATAVSSSSGAFTFATLESGTYTLSFAATKSTYAQYLGNTTDLSLAETLTLSDGAGNHTYLTASLSGSGTLTGTVRTSSGTALKNFTVRATPFAGGGTTVAGSAVTSASGAYTIAGLIPGDYRLEALDASSATPVYSPDFGGNRPDIAISNVYTVTSGSSQTVNFAMQKSATISGKVTGLSGTTVENLAGVRVTPYYLGEADCSDCAESVGSRSVLTAANGTYSISGLEGGYYTLEFQPRTSAPLPASGTVYGRSFLGGVDNVKDSDTFLVEGTENESGTDITLIAGATIGGKVVDSLHPTGSGLPNIRVTLDYEDFSADNAASDNAPTVLTDANGLFSFPGLGAGQYSFTLGSSSDTTPLSGEDTTWQRESVDVANTVIVNEHYSQIVSIVKKDAQGLRATTAPAITVLSTLEVGQELSASTGTWSSTIDSDPSYQWYRGGQPIDDAGESEYRLQPGDAGYSISVRVTAHNLAYGTATASSTSTGVVALGSGLFLNGSVSITGDDHVGKTLTVGAEEWEADSSDQNPLVSYQWEVSTNQTSWTPLSGEVGPSHVVTANDLSQGPYLRVHLVGALEGFVSASGDTETATTQAGTISMTKAPKLTKTGTTYSLTTGSWSPSGGSNTIAWDVYDPNGTLLNTVTASSITRASVVGKYVSVYVVHQEPGYTLAVSPAIVVQQSTAPVPSGSHNITSTATKVGVELDAPILTWTPAVASVSYQWQRGTGSSWASLSGKTSHYYVPTASDVGHTFRVILTTHVTGYPSAVVTTPATAAVTLGDAATYAGSPVYAFTGGTVTTGTKIYLTGGSWNGNPTSYSYQWETSTNGGGTFSPIVGQTGENIVIPGGLTGKELYVHVVASTPGHSSGGIDFGGNVIAKGAFLELTRPKVTRSGSNFVVTTGTWTPSPTSYSYHWFVSQPNGSSTTTVTSSPTFAAASAGSQHVAVEVLPSGSLANDGDSGLLDAQIGTLTPTGALTIGTLSGSVGSVFTAPTPPSWTNLNSPSLVTYQWQYQSGSSWKSLIGQVNTTFTPPSTYFGKTLRVAITAASSGYKTTTAYSLSQVVHASSTALTPGTGLSAPKLTGNNVVDEAMSVTPGNWSAVGLAFTYQWGTKSGSTLVPIQDATGSNYTIPSQYLGDTIGVTITAKGAGYPDGTATVFESTAVGDGTIANFSAPKVTAGSGGTLKATTGSWSVSAPALTYNWEVINASDGSVLYETNGFGNTYTPPGGTTGDFVRLTVGATKPGYIGTSMIVVARQGAAIHVTSNLTVTGSKIITTSATAATASWSVPSPTVTYQWYRGSAKIGGATANAYVPKTSDIGKLISVAETASKFGYKSVTYKVTYGTALSNLAVLVTTELPSITGGHAVDSTVTAHPGTWNLPGLKFSYTWIRGNQSIPGATGSTYKLTAADSGAQIEVYVGASKANYSTGSGFSNPFTVDPGVPLSLTKLTLPVAATLGTKLTPTLGSWNFAATTQYDWQYEPSGGSAWSDIAGASSNTYTPSAADGIAAGGKIQLIIIATRPGHPTSFVTSTATTVG